MNQMNMGVIGNFNPQFQAYNNYGGMMNQIGTMGQMSPMGQTNGMNQGLNPMNSMSSLINMNNNGLLGTALGSSQGNNPISLNQGTTTPITDTKTTQSGEFNFKQKDQAPHIQGSTPLPTNFNPNTQAAQVLTPPSPNVILY